MWLNLDIQTLNMALDEERFVAKLAYSETLNMALDSGGRTVCG